MSLHDGSAAAASRAAGGDVGSLVMGAAGGDDWAWGQLVARLSDLVSTVIEAHRLTDAEAARVSAMVWRRLNRNLGKIRRPDGVGAWLGAVARDECVNTVTSAARKAA